MTPSSLRLASDDSKEIREESPDDLACRFLSELPRLRSVLRTDVEAAYDGDPAAKSFEEIILASALSTSIDNSSSSVGLILA